VPVPPCVVDVSHFRHVTFGLCPAGTRNSYFTVDPLGNLRPCNHSPTILGNLSAEPFQSLAEGADSRSFARALPPVCFRCSLARSCQGGCKAAGEACFGSPSVPEPWFARCRSALCEASG
jgi:radical SAM protein with 4Fe4S-binding SPASM domain